MAPEGDPIELGRPPGLRSFFTRVRGLGRDLDSLELTYDRKFAELWEFVAFAETEHPELDLLTPSKRPK